MNSDSRTLLVSNEMGFFARLKDGVNLILNESSESTLLSVCLMVAELSCRPVLQYINLLKMKISVLFCLFVCLWFFVPLEIEFIWRRHNYK